MRLAVAVLIGSLGSVGMWSVVVALPVVQNEFAASRGTASLAFTMVMLGFGSGGVLTGKITDRYGIVVAIGLGIGILGLGYIGAGLSGSIWQFILVHFFIGLSSSATFGPLMAEASHWFDRYRGLAVTIAASFTLKPRIERGELEAVRLTRRGFPRPWTAVFRASTSLSGPIHSLLETLKRYGPAGNR